VKWDDFFRNDRLKVEEDRSWLRWQMRQTANGKGGEISLMEFSATEYGRKGKVVASEEVKSAIQIIGINKCARDSGFDRKNFIRNSHEVCR
jgi:hypothetical protein